jgi:hypothetical protein
MSAAEPGEQLLERHRLAADLAGDPGTARIKI